MNNSPKITHSPAPVPYGAGLEFVIVLILILFVGWQHLLFAQSLERQSQLIYPDRTVPSATQGNRVLTDVDCYTWLALSRQMIDTGEWRINHANFDNPPQGREVHWNSLLCWLLVALAWISHLLTGDPIHAALENAAFQINLLLVLCLGILWYSIARTRFGRWPTLVGLALLLTLPELQFSFMPGNTDHQTLHLIALLGSIGFLLRGGLGWTQQATGGLPSCDFPPTKQRALRDSTIAGAFGAFGLWIGATVQINTLILTGAGLFILSLFRLHPDPLDGRVLFHPRFWRNWAYSGSAFTLLFFLIQYFPGDMRMRLEAIHPLHAVSWAGVGWLLRRPSPSRPLCYSARATGIFFTIHSSCGFKPRPLKVCRFMPWEEAWSKVSGTNFLSCRCSY